jgi:hypothetical protein
MGSEGDLTADGLMPSRYDEDTQAVFRERRRVSVVFEPDAVVLANGDRRERWRGVQDTASQFIQLTYLFTTRPELLRVGGAVEVPLALPRNVDRWIYDVIGEAVIQTPFGPLSTFHLKPRRVRKMTTELSAEDLVRAAAALPAGPHSHRAGSADLPRPGDRAQARAGVALNHRQRSARAMPSDSYSRAITPQTKR